MKFSAKITAPLLALALSMTACAAAPDAAITASTAPTPAAESTPQLSTDLTAITTWSGFAMGQNAVYNVMNVNGEGRYFATTIDLTTGQQQILCYKPNCPHEDDTCPGFMAQSASGAVPTAYLIPAPDRLYWIIDGRFNDSCGAYVDVSDLDGRNRHRIVEGDDLPDLGVVNNWYADGSALYTAYYSGSDFLILRIDETGAAIIGQKTRSDSEWYHAVGCWQDKIILQHNEYYYIPELKKAGDTATKEEYDAWYDEQDAAQLTQPVSLYLLGTDREEHPLDFHWTVTDSAIAKVQNGIVYLLSPGGTVTQMNLSTGSSTTQSFDLPGQAVPDDPDILPGNWASVYITDLGNGNNECLLNLDTGEFQPQPTTWFKDQAAPRCPIIWAADHGMLFLQYGEVYYTEKGIGPDGLPASYTVGRNEYGIISFDDYLAGSQDWVHVTLLGDDFA